MLLNNFLNFKTINATKKSGIDKINLSRFNREHQNSTTLYVGSSTTDFVTRIKNHFGIMGKRMYSLHLAKWDEDYDYEIILETYQLKTNIEGEILERFVVEIVEQQIWEELKPMFGKKSGL